MEKHERWSNLALFPGLPVLRFIFSVIHGSGRTKNREGLGTRLGQTRECTGSANVKPRGQGLSLLRVEGAIDLLLLVVSCLTKAC